jgi:hypothetical protein
MNTPSGPRKTTNLSESVQQHLNMYAIAAIVAALSVLALSERSEAKIVYTPVNIQLGTTYPLDLNDDGIPDFTLELRALEKDGCNRRGSSIALDDLAAQKGNGAVPGSDGLAAVLGRGAEIGPSQKFTSPQIMAAVWGYWFYNVFDHECEPYEGENGLWLNVSNGYLGLAFHIKEQTHYGWARLSVQVGYVYITATLTGYAYETTAGKSIKAGQKKEAADDFTNEDFGPDAFLTNPIPDIPQPATLGMLALGAQGVPLWRRKEEIETVK